MRTDRGPMPAGTGGLTRRSLYVEPRNGATCGERRRVSYPPPHGAWRSLVSALVWGTRGPEFKSRRPDRKPCKRGAFAFERSAVDGAQWVPERGQPSSATATRG